MVRGTTITLYKPYDHQNAVHKAITEHIETVQRFTPEFQKIFVVKACRQVGKSAMAINELSRFALTFPFSTNGYVAPTLKLSRKTYDEMLRMFKVTGLITKTNAQDLILEFFNEATVQFFSGEQRDNLRGYTISGLSVVDEAAFIRSDIYNECISPWVDAKKAVTLIISTPKFKTGFFYDLFSEGETGTNPMIISNDFTRYDLTAIRSQEVLDMKRKSMPAQSFRSEYLGEFLEAEGSVFGKFGHLLLDQMPEYEDLYFGLDFGTGSGQDYTVLTAFNERGEQCYLWRVNDMSPTEQVDYIAGVMESFVETTKRKDRFGTDRVTKVNHVKGFMAEQNSIGKVYLDLLWDKGIEVQPFVTSASSKTQIIQNLQVAIEQGKIRLLNDANQSAELALYESKQNPTTLHVSYNAPNGEHDDTVMALAIAYECYEQMTLGIQIR